MDEQCQAIFDAGQLLLQELDHQVAVALRGLRHSVHLPALDTCQGDEIVEAREDYDLCRSARQEMGYALECLYLHTGVTPGGGLHCRLAVERLNDDVIREIFRWTDIMYDHRAIDGVPQFTTAFGLACVSRCWRAVALETATIWTKVRVRFGASVYETLSERFDAILERSGTCELDLVLLSAPCRNQRVLTRTIMATLARVFGRCRFIQVSWADSSVRFNGSLLPLLLAEMPTLRHFRVVQHPDEAVMLEVRDQPMGVTYLTLCPNVRVLELDRLPLDSIALHAMPNVEVFSTRSIISAQDLLTIQRAWPGLKRLQLHGVYPTAHWDDAAVFVELHTVACVSPGLTLLRVLSRVHMPQLRTLFLKCDSHAISEAFNEFIQPRSFGSIRILTLTGAYANRVSCWLPLLPDLVELTMVKMAEQNMLSLFPPWMNQRLTARVPQLSCLRLIDCAFGISVVQSFISFITVGVDTGTAPPLRRLVVLEGGWGYCRDDGFPPWLIPWAERVLDSVSVGPSTLDGHVSLCSWI